ncbi:MAG: hypothetical protein M1320_01020 [Patescibacteria group bacterium]|nr:hypothetical protein [Patescibacteria group bacterium]
MPNFKILIQWKDRMHKKTLLVLEIIAGIVVLAFFAFIFSSLSKNSIPDDFYTSRQSASDYAQNIVTMLAQTGDNITALQKGTGFKTRSDAADMITAEIQKNKDIREKAVQLALDLEQMAKSVPDISPKEAAQTALVAISQETALIGQLLSYNNDLNQLLLLAQEELVNGFRNYSEMNAIIAKVNAEASEINNLNSRFNDEMKKFDAFYGR